MAEKTPFQQEIADMIVEVLNLEDISADDIDVDAPLFGDGLGLDSVDALELSLEISRRYGYRIRSGDPDTDKIFQSLGTLAQMIERRRAE